MKIISISFSVFFFSIKNVVSALVRIGLFGFFFFFLTKCIYKSYLHRYNQDHVNFVLHTSKNTTTKIFVKKNMSCLTHVLFLNPTLGTFFIIVFWIFVLKTIHEYKYSTVNFLRKKSTYSMSYIFKLETSGNLAKTFRFFV